MADLILGLDPGSRRTGYGVVSVEGDSLKHVAHGVIALKDSFSFAERLGILQAELQSLFHRFAIQTTVVERIFFGKNADSAFKLGHARGVCIAVSAQARVPIEEYAARYVKKSVTGSGAASKDHVQMIVLALLGLKPQTLQLDASDALSLAITHARMREINARLKQALKENSP